MLQKRDNTLINKNILKSKNILKNRNLSKNSNMLRDNILWRYKILFSIALFSFTLFSFTLFFSSSLDAQNTTSAKRSKVKVLAEYPHSRKSYTQGLFFFNGTMYETCGEYGKSSLKIVDYKKGKVLREWKFNRKYFLEGSCVANGGLYILTWQEKTCFKFTVPPPVKATSNDLKLLGTANYNTEGWGLTSDGKELIMSNGTNQLYFLDPSSFYCKRVLNVTINGSPLYYLNELEFIEGKIWANVYTAEYIVIIDPNSGVVEHIIDCTGILPENLKTHSTDVLNGIAYNPEDKSIYITGKNWPRLYKISL